jgi:hypothetical protein
MNLTEQEHADLLLKVREENLTQTALFRFLVSGYLKDEANIRKAVDKYLEEQRLVKRDKLKTHSRSLLKGKNIEKTFALTQEDVEDLYDIIEELGDI